jgi:hypothetical protein
MSDQQHDHDHGQVDVARQIAAQCGAIGICATCGHTWTTDEFDPDDDDSMAELLDAAHAVIDENPELDRFDDDGGLAHMLSHAVADAAPEKECAHA